VIALRGAARPLSAVARSWGYRSALAVTVGASSLILLSTLDRGWYPWDEGTLGQMAERVLQGQLPHRDFVDTYTGALTFFDAGVFWLFGTDLLWLRVAMLPFFLAFVVAAFYVATRVMPPAAAVAFTVAIVVWSVPNYPAAMPSWFNLFFATIGVAALARWLESRRQRWLWLAGFAGGLSVTVKIVGLYYLAGAVLFLLVRPLLGARATARRQTVGGIGIAALSLACLLSVIDVLRPRLGHGEIVALLVPTAAVLSAIAFVAVRSCPPSRRVVGAALGDVAPLLGGAVVPLAAFLVPYVVTGSVGALVHDLSQSSRLRLQFAAMAPIGPKWLITAAPLVLVAVAPRIPGRPGKAVSLVLAAGYLAAALVVDRTRAFDVFFNPLREIVPILSVAWGIVVVRRASIERGTRELLALLVIVMAFTALIQFPFGSWIYFLYVLPLAALAGAASLAALGGSREPLYLVVLVAYLVVGARELTPGITGFVDGLSGRHPGLVRLDASRGRIYVPTGDAARYRRITGLLLLHAEGGYTFAGPDAPEVYYLANLRNATPMIYDFLTPEADRDRYVLDAISRHHITAIVVNRSPSFSRSLDEHLVDRLDRMYPAHVLIDEFDVRWRS
jgi:hypothetical protein